MTINNYSIYLFTSTFQKYIHYHPNDPIYILIFLYKCVLQNIINKNLITQQIQNEHDLFRRVPSKFYPALNAPLE